MTFDRAIWRLLMVDQQIAACVTAQMGSVFNRLNAVVSLAHERGASKDVCNKLSTYAGSVGSLNEARNRIVHDARFLGVEAQKITRFQATAKKRLEFEHQPEDIKTLHDLTDKMAQSEKGICQDLAGTRSGAKCIAADSASEATSTNSVSLSGANRSKCILITSEAAAVIAGVISIFSFFGSSVICVGDRRTLERRKHA